MNRGVRSGLTAATWRSYQPKLLTVNTDPGGAGLTQPTLDTFDGRYQFGRFMVLDGLVRVQVQMAFLGSSTVGVGTAYVMSLPERARRPVSGASVVPIGNAMAYWSTVGPFVNVPCCATLADPWASLAGQEDNYAQFFAPQVTAWGTATFGGGAVTITHNLGFAPPANAFTLTEYSFNGTAQQLLPFQVQSITTTTAAIRTLNTNGGNGNDFGWKIIAEPPTGQGGNLVGPKVPFDWSQFTSLGPFGNMFVELTYEPA